MISGHDFQNVFSIVLKRLAALFCQLAGGFGLFPYKRFRNFYESGILQPGQVSGKIPGGHFRGPLQIDKISIGDNEKVCHDQQPRGFVNDLVEGVWFQGHSLYAFGFCIKKPTK